MEDQAIIDLYWERSEGAIEETAKKYGAYCTSISYGILRNRQDAEECVQDTYLRAWNAMPPQRPNRLAAFLGKITRNLSLDQYRRQKASFRGCGQIPLVLEELEGVVSSDTTAEDLTELKELTKALQQFLGQLSLEKRKVFLLRYWYFRSIEEIAAQLQMKKPKITSMLFRMRRNLKEFLEQEGIVV